MKIINPYEGSFDLPWFKGDLHIHSNLSDGRATRQEIQSRLLECGFDFAALADHDRYFPTREDFHPLFIGNSEMRSREGGDMLTLFAEIKHDPQSGVQDLIERTRKAGGLPILAHPRIGEFTMAKHHWSFPCYKLIGVYHDYFGIEIYTHNIGSGFQAAIDRLDAIWVSRCRELPDQPVGVWGFATSDAHSIESITPNVGILVAADSCSPSLLRTALERGRFYSLAGSEARFTQISVSDGALRVIARNARLVRMFGCPQSNAPADQRLLSISWAEDGAKHVEVVYRLTGKEGFVRIEAIDAGGGTVYANPIRVIPLKQHKA